LIDADNVETPGSISGLGKVEGNIIEDGIEFSPEGEHVAYYVRQINKNNDWKRIPAGGKKTKRLQAYLVYGNRYRLNNNRGIPIFTSSLETLKKLDRYKEAAVASAEERAKIPYFIEHDMNSTGTNLLLDKMAQELDPNANVQGDFSPTTKLTEKIATSTQKTVFNLEVGSKIKAMAHDNELTFKEFYNTIVSSIASSILLPPEVALSKYESSFSSSRAALKDWEHMLNVARNDFATQFIRPIFELWLDLQITTGVIVDEGYMKARNSNDVMLKLAYLNARWIGANVPHIDPLKEVKASREKLGPLAANLPLSTISKETEGLNTGEFDENVERFNKEIKKVDVPEPVEPVKPNSE